MAKHPLIKLQQHIEQRQWTSAMALLSNRKILQQLDCTRNDVRSAVGMALAMYAETGNMTDPHFPQVMVRVMERCQNHEWLLQFGDERFYQDDFETALQSYTAARLGSKPDAQKQEREATVKAILLEKAKELCMEGMPMQAFDYIKKIDAFALISEPQLASTIANAAHNYWNARAPEVQSPKQYTTMGLPKVEEMLLAADRADILYRTCAKDIEQKVQQECYNAAQGILPEQQSWQHEYVRILRRVLEMQVGKEVLTPLELESIGDYALSIGNTSLAWTAYLKQGNTKGLEQLVCALTHHPKAEHAREICNIIGQIGKENLSECTLQTLRQFQLRLLHLLPKDIRKKPTDPKSEERERLEYYCREIGAFLGQSTGDQHCEG